MELLVLIIVIIIAASVGYYLGVDAGYYKLLTGMAKPEKLKKKGGRRMPRILRWIFYVMILTLVWKVVSAIDVVAIATWLSKQI